MNIKFIGDLSTSDARVLYEVVRAKRVLEFGCGGSTQILAQFATRVVSVETEPEWIERTKRNLALLPATSAVEFVIYDDLILGEQFDVVFVDGVPNKRLKFAEAAWPCLAKGGVMIFHDTRRFEYFKEAAWIAQLHFSEIMLIEVNKEESNLTLIHKRERPLHYVNWNEVEGKPAWAYGKAERPEGADLWETKL